MKRKRDWMRALISGVCAACCFSSFSAAVFSHIDTISANAGVLEDRYLSDCVDICDAQWLGTGEEGTYGWSNKEYVTQTLNTETIGITLEKYRHQWTNEYVLYWYGGDEGGLYDQEDVFAVEFAVNMTDDGFSLRVDQYSFWINSEWIRIGFNDQWTNDDFHRTYWFGDIGLKASWLVQKPVELSGIVKVRAYVYTENGETTFVVDAGGYSAMATTPHERKYFSSCCIIAGYPGLTVYSSSVADVYADAQKAERYAGYQVVPETNKTELMQAAESVKETLVNAQSLTAETLSSAQADMKNCLTEELLTLTKNNAVTLLQNASAGAETIAKVGDCKTVDEIEDVYLKAVEENKTPPVSSETEGEDSVSSEGQPNSGCASISNGVGACIAASLVLLGCVKRKKD